MVREALRWYIALATIVIFLGTPLCVETADASGLPLRTRIPSEQALVVIAGGEQHIITSVQLEASAQGAAVLFPVPGVPEVDQPPGAERLFDYLAEATKPTQQALTPQTNAARNDGVDIGGVQVLGRTMIGGYDVARLDANDPQALARWLSDNEYMLPPEAQPILNAYISEGWKFVAVKLANGSPANGSLAPLRIRFAAQQVVYPTRLAALASQPIDLQLYLLSDHRMRIDGMETLFAGPVTQLSPAPDSAVSALLADTSYLTSLHAPALDHASIHGDFAIYRAADDTPYRAVEQVKRQTAPLRSYALPLALICSVLLSLSAFMGSLAIRRRLDRM